MVKKTLLLLISIVCFVSVSCNPEFVWGLIRHGARSPMLGTAKNPAHSWKDGLMELTGSGMRQGYLLGVYLKEKYVGEGKLLGTEYDPAEIYVRATNTNRTIMAAQSILMGMYPSSPEKLSQDQEDAAVPDWIRDHLTPDVWTNLKLSPLPFGMNAFAVHAFAHEEDVYYTEFCPAAEMQRLNSYATDTNVFEIMEHYKELKDTIITLMGLDPVAYRFPHFYPILEVIYAAKFDQRETVFTQAQLDEAEEMMNALAFHYYSFDMTAMVYRNAGVFQELIQVMADHSHKMHLVVGHELTLSSFLRAMAFDGFEGYFHYFPFSSNLFLEVDTGNSVTADGDFPDFPIKWIYNGEDITSKMGGCHGVADCHVAHFTTYMQEIVEGKGATDWVEFCAMEPVGPIIRIEQEQQTE